MLLKSSVQATVLSLITILFFSCGTPSEKAIEQTGSIPNTADTLAANRADRTVSATNLKIAYIYGDTVNNKYQFLLDAEAELESERKRIDRRLRNKLEDAEKQASILQQRAPTMTQNEMQEAQLLLQNLDLEMQQYQEKLASDFRKRESELQRQYIDKVNSFLDEYNSDGHYDMVFNFQQGGNLLWIKQAYDITDEVVAGLNKAYEDELSKKKLDKEKP